MFYYIYSKFDGKLVLKTTRINSAILACFPKSDFDVILSDPNFDLMEQ